MRLLPATLALALVAGPAVAQHKHPPEHAALHERFYSSWMRPDNRRHSCCNNLDCAPTEARFDPMRKRWSAFSPAHNDWIDIPEHTIEREFDVPPGAHLCVNKSGVICFGIGGGT
jgi:hypothetical protein